MYFDEKLPEERAHYAAQTFDQLVRVSRLGWLEVSGHAYRTDYDLSRHMRYSGKDLTVFRQFKEPIRIKKKVVLVNPAWVGRTFKSKAKEVLEAIKSLNVNEVEKMLKEKGVVEVNGVTIPAEHVRIVEKEEKISGRRFLPHVAEPSFGIERLVFVVLDKAYREKSGRVVLSIPRRIAPIDVAVFPLVRDERLVKIAKDVWRRLIEAGYYAIYDDDGSIGRRYARVDEIGVPLAITVDHVTLEDKTVTIRDRDTWKQVRVHLDKVEKAIRMFLQGIELDLLTSI